LKYQFEQFEKRIYSRCEKDIIEDKLLALINCVIKTSVMNSIELSIFSSRIEAVCEEMGEVLRFSAFSPNIKDRLDFSCAVFDGQGELCAQAAHIPVHLGSMAYAMRGIVNQIKWQPGDMVVLNDPYMGGTHLPDVTMIAPLFADQKLFAFIVNRAHHADIGAASPGSMPLSESLHEEGLVISPRKLIKNDQLDEKYLQFITSHMACHDSARGDFMAQISANQTGLKRLQVLLQEIGSNYFLSALGELNDYASRIANKALAVIPDGEYCFTDYMDDDGMGYEKIPITATISVTRGELAVDFSGTAEQVSGNINCPLSVAAAAVYYAFRCLMPAHTPACAGAFRHIRLSAPKGCLVNATFPAAVAAGNVETSTRVVDVVLGALHKALPDAIPAASYGSMNNVAMGGKAENGLDAWNYYETIAGGMGANRDYPGLNAVQAHMTNTLNTPIESLEYHFPLRVRSYSLNHGSGGKGRHPGGHGVVRSMEFLQNTHVTLLTERRLNAPWGLVNGDDGCCGENWLDDQKLAAKTQFEAKTGQILTIKTPGGGGWGGL